MPVFNAERFLGPCLDSIQGQTFRDWELVAVDDGSIDNSYRILKNASKFDRRIRVFKNAQNLGVGATLNRIVKLAKGKYLARMDADDQMFSTRLQKQGEYLDKHPDTVVVGGQCELINLEGKSIGQKNYPIGDREIRRMIFTFSPMSHPTIMVNRGIIPEDFSWYNPFACPAEDIDLYFKLFQFGKFVNLSDTLTKYRLYSSSTSFRNPKQNFAKTRQIRQRAIKRFGYKPGLRAKVVSFMEAAAIRILPDRFIYPLYVAIRGLVEIKISLSVNLTRLTKSLVFDFDF